MAGECNKLPPIVIGLPWNVYFSSIPENLSGKTVQFILRKRASEDIIGTYTNPTNITIGTPGSTTPITLSLSASDTSGFTPQTVDYSLRVLGSYEYVIGQILVKS